MRRLLVVLVAAAMLAVACGGGGGDSDSGGGDAAFSAVTGAATTAAQDRQFDESGTLRYGNAIGVSSFDPSKGTTAYDNTALFLTYDRLVHLSPEAEAVPGLATSWEFSEDGTSLTLELREGVVFQDGAAFDANVAKANLERNKAGNAKGDLAPVSSIEVVDPLTLKLNLGSPGGSLPLALSDRGGVMVSPNAIADPSLDLNPVGAGMYKVVEYQKDAKIVYERWDGYWDPAAVKNQRIEFVVLPDPNTMLNALRSGALDAATVLPQQVRELESLGFTVQQGLTYSFYDMHLNRTSPFLDDRNVRRALNMAIDREAMVEGIGLGYGAASVQEFPDGYWAHNPEIGPDYVPYDPEGAKELLVAAGVPEGQSYEAIVPSNNLYPQLAEAAKDMLSQVGIDLQIRLVDPVATGGIFFGQQEGDLMVAIWGGRSDPAQTMSLLYTSGSFQNPGGHTTPAITELAAAAGQPGTPEERADALHELVRAVADESMNVILYHAPFLFAHTADVAGMPVWVTAKPEFRGVGLLAG